MGFTTYLVRRNTAQMKKENPHNGPSSSTTQTHEHRRTESRDHHVTFRVSERVSSLPLPGGVLLRNVVMVVP